MEILFWLSAAFIAYVYVGYPVLLAVWARTVARRRAARRSTARLERQNALPGVSVIIAARDEAQRLPARVENILASDYPRERMQIIVASDGSTDNTAEVLAPYRDVVELLLLPRSGKASALNAAVESAHHPILVFADARQQFASDAIRRLTAPFRHPEIGCVSGELMLDPTASTIGDGVGAYWKYEKWLRKKEAVVGSTLGVTGAIYAMRRWLWQPLPADTLLDDVLGPMRVVLRGYRVTFQSEARAFDRATKDAASELRRKVRTLAGNFQLLTQEPRLLLPWSNPVWFQFMSHKVGRLLVPYALVTLLATSPVLAMRSWFYAAAFGGQLALYALAIYGAMLDHRARARVTANEVFHEAA